MMLTDHKERQVSARKRRVGRAAVAVGIVTAVLALTVGVALAFFGDTSTSSNNLALGTVALNVGSSPSSTCTYNSLNPGDLTGSKACALSVTYTGSISAFVSLDVLIETKAGSGAGARTLYDPTTGKGLTFSISDNGGNSFTVPTIATTCPTAPAGSTCYELDYELAASGPTNLTFSTADVVTWTVTPVFPKGAGNPYQGATATLTLTAQAVQAPGNPLPAGCNTSTIGQSCPASSPFAWS